VIRVALWVLGLVAFVASLGLQMTLEDRKGYADFVAAASRVGWGVLIFAVAVLVADVAMLIVLTVRHGRSDRPRGEVVTEDRPLGAMHLGQPPLMGRSKRKVLGSKSTFVSMRSLVDGTASVRERMFAGGVVALFVSFALLWVGAGLILMKKLLILALLPILPGLFVYYNLRAAWDDYRDAKRTDARQTVRHGHS